MGGGQLTPESSDSNGERDGHGWTRVHWCILEFDINSLLNWFYESETCNLELWGILRICETMLNYQIIDSRRLLSQLHLPEWQRLSSNWPLVDRINVIRFKLVLYLSLFSVCFSQIKIKISHNNSQMRLKRDSRLFPKGEFNYY